MGESPQKRQLIAAALADEDVMEIFRHAGVAPAANSPEVFAAFIANEIARWRPVAARFRHLTV